MTLDWNEIWKTLLERGGRVVLAVIVGFLLYRGVVLITRRIRQHVDDGDPTVNSEREKRAETLGRIVRQVTLVVLLLVIGMMILREVGFDIAPILAGAGIAGLAVGFGAQNLVRDVITGFFLLLENQIRVGDVVEIAGKTGRVEQVNLRTTVLRDLKGTVHIVPNGEVTTVSNLTVGWSRTVIDFGVAYREDVDRVIEVLRKVGEGLCEDPAWKGKILEPMEVFGLEALADSSVNIRIGIKTRPLEQWGVGREMRRRVKRAFDEQGIEIPFPHRTVYLQRSEDDGTRTS